MPSDLALIFGIPVLILVIAFIVERVIDLFDKIIVLNLFPWWRAIPEPPPVDPVDELIEKLVTEQPGRLASVSEFKAAFLPDEIAIAYLILYPEYPRQLVYYIVKYGYFLSQHGLWQQVIRWVVNDETFPYPYSLVENWLARQEGISHFPERDTKFAECLVNDGDYVEIVLDSLKPLRRQPTEITESKKSPIQSRSHSCAGEPIPEIGELIGKLQIWADYCYQRNQRTSEAFAKIKHQVYLVTGAVLGIFLIEVLLPLFMAELLQIAQRPGGQGRRWVGGSSGALGGGFQGWARRFGNTVSRVLGRFRGP